MLHNGCNAIEKREALRKFTFHLSSCSFYIPLVEDMLKNNAAHFMFFDHIFEENFSFEKLKKAMEDTTHKTPKI